MTWPDDALKPLWNKGFSAVMARKNTPENPVPATVKAQRKPRAGLCQSAAQTGLREAPPLVCPQGPWSDCFPLESNHPARGGAVDWRCPVGPLRWVSRSWIFLDLLESQESTPQIECPGRLLTRGRLVGKRGVREDGKRHPGPTAPSATPPKESSRTGGRAAKSEHP